KIFGLGAKFLEILIIKHLYEIIGETIEWKDEEEFTFKRYLEVAKQNFQLKNCRK
ncbi:hypothetical protein H5T51_09245, partial [Candidatus Bathyarchaeota archaeon]|nr:hypothetical protein [Candidatus Bathyarchaeota archaeon]